MKVDSHVRYAQGEVVLDTVHCDGGEQEEEATRAYLRCRRYREWREVFTLPPYSTWIPCGIYVESMLFHMEYVLAEISPTLVIFFHLYSTWNGVDSMWIPPFHMEFPHEFHPISMWIPCGFQVESPTTNIRIIEIIVQINTEQ